MKYWFALIGASAIILAVSCSSSFKAANVGYAHRPLNYKLSSSLTPTTDGADWEAIAKVTTLKIPRLEMLVEGEDAPGICSAVVISIDADRSAEALTAAHCVAHPPGKHFDLTVNGRHAEVLIYNNLLDLAIIHFRAKKEEVIALAPQTPSMGAEVAVMGYAFGIEEPAAQFGHVAQPFNKETKALWINLDLIFGDSGGAVIDAQGRLVGINSRIYHGGPAHMGAAVPIEAVVDFLDSYEHARTKAAKK